METTPRCPECGAELPADAPHGLCPGCLLKRGLEPHTIEGTAPEVARWTPPGIDELADRFPELQITRLIGRGGMGAVYQARQKNLDRTVALKFLPPERGHDPAFAQRFAHEAQAMARLNHPHIVTIYEFGERSGIYYFMMEYVEGVSLRGLLDSGHVAPPEALAIVPQVCGALQYAHDRGIVHRDIKPENILLDKQGQVKIADFGLAKLMGPAAPGADPAGEGVMGTPRYMAPEQRERPADVDHRADIYALGVVFYQMLTGELPDTRAYDPPSHKVRLDTRLDEVVHRAMQHEPQHRYQQASEMKTDVETIHASPPADPPPASALPDGPVSPRFSRTAIVGAAWAPGVVVILFLSFALLWHVPVQPGEHVPVRPGEHEGAFGVSLGLLLAMGIGGFGITAPFGTTILGCVAIAQIRRSAGRVYGLSLALFDALVFPLLTLTGAIAWFWTWFFWDYLYPYVIAHHDPQTRMSLIEDFICNHQTALSVFSTIITAGVLGTLIVRRVWRAITQPLPAGIG